MLTTETSSWHLFPIMRRYAKGYKKIFVFYVLDTAMYNSYVLQAVKTGKKGCGTEWKTSLAEGIIEETAHLDTEGDVRTLLTMRCALR